MGKLLFVTAGIPVSADPPDIVTGLQRLKALGLDGMEIEFVKGVYPHEHECEEIARVSSELGLRLSAHAPYYLNFNAREPSKRRASQGMLHKAVRMASLCGAKDLVFHVGFYLGDDAEEAYGRVRPYLNEVAGRLKEEGVEIVLRPETSGKGTQFGSLHEILQLCQDIDALAPCIDFAHWHARTGAFNTYSEFGTILNEIRDKLGEDALQNLHLHVSGIEYSPKGEVRHLPLQESDLNYMELLRCLKEYDVGGTVVSESPCNDDDGLLLKTVYESLP